ncbi:elongation factor Ts, mitochondrial [Thrips palmi]|uniref:Elongation factor Ts, mitochondrial n=1 Tax=Thrips palmi TaxID=161013 RepID=A0A6P8Y4M0_THRPL|nr:elongation factor Ts, mitochondrial [Thrips palmi]
MFASKQLVRFFVTTPSSWNSSKALLAKLRKKTGYSFANCKKALDKHNNDAEQAEKWLHEQAQALGWSKATNVGNRKTTEGLVAVIVNKNHGAMVELNCETDFVARNSSFQTLIQMIAKSCVSVVPEVCGSNNSVTKELLDGSKLSSLSAPDGKTLADHVALNIGLLGENMTLKRAVLVSTKDDILLSGYSHPSPKEQNEALLGKYGAIVAFNSKDQQPLSDEQIKLGRQLCQHVIGMNPKSIGNNETDKPQDNADDETVMIYQEYLLDPETKVEAVLQEGNVNVVDFVRFECGETDVVTEDVSAARAQA